MVNVFTGRSAKDCISATTVEESIPPDNSAPSGTSASMRNRTASVRSVSSSQTASSSPPESCVTEPCHAALSADQNAFEAGSAVPGSVIVRMWPGGSLIACRKMLCGAGTYRYRRYEVTAAMTIDEHWLDAKPIPNQRELTALQVPDSNSEHPDEAAD